MLTLYEQAVQNAFRETRDALVAGEKTAQAQERPCSGPRIQYVPVKKSSAACSDSY